VTSTAAVDSAKPLLARLEKLLLQRSTEEHSSSTRWSDVLHARRNLLDSHRNWRCACPSLHRMCCRAVFPVKLNYAGGATEPLDDFLLSAAARSYCLTHLAVFGWGSVQVSTLLAVDAMCPYLEISRATLSRSAESIRATTCTSTHNSSRLQTSVSGKLQIKQIALLIGILGMILGVTPPRLYSVL
jgi:hypothetical protein